MDGYVLQECFRIAADENETPARRRRAEYWAKRILDSADGWEGGGVTKAEAAGITVDPKAPGGQKVYSSSSSGGRVDRSGEDIEAGSLSTELHSSQRQGHWRARERST